MLLWFQEMVVDTKEIEGNAAAEAEVVVVVEEVIGKAIGDALIQGNVLPIEHKYNYEPQVYKEKTLIVKLFVYHVRMIYSLAFSL